MDNDELVRLAARGLLAGAVATELSEPLERVARLLEKAIERLDGHVAASRGPEPLPYHTVGELRERVADAYMDVGRVARLAADLASVIAAPLARAAQPTDVNELVERALSLARHRFGADSEVLLDLGTLPVIEIDPVRVVQALAHLLFDAAAAASAVGGTVNLTTDAAAGGVRVTLAYPSAPRGVMPFAALIDRSLDAEGARITYSDDGERTQAVLLLAARK